MRLLLLLPLLFLFSCENSSSDLDPDPHRFDQEIKRFAKMVIPEGEGVVVFTGSSSIRMWNNLAEDCSGMQLVNTGFGGSEMSDLLYFLEETVLRFNPKKVYIYEGDNDIAAEKSPEAILKTTKKVVKKIFAHNSAINIYFISAKPSPSRWNYKEQYEAFNTLLNDYCTQNPQLYYVDVWTKMLAENGRPSPSIFIADSLHMNRQGYLLWKEIICSH